MNSRERQLIAIRHQIPDRIPIDATAVENQREIAEFLCIGSGTVLDRLGLDGRIIAPPYVGELPPPVDGMPSTEWGTLDSGDYGTTMVRPLSDVSSVRQVEKHPWPDAANYDYDWARQAAGTLGNQYAVRGPYWKPLFCRVCDLFGMEEAMAKIVLKPLILEAALDRVFAFTADLCTRHPAPLICHPRTSAG